MCLILFAYALRPDLPLVVAANRDEFHARPTAPLQTWRDHPEVVAGRDLQDGGTWMGVNTRGRFAAVTNFSEEPPAAANPQRTLRSRGELPTDFLLSQQAPLAYLQQLAERAQSYRGFNLLVADESGLFYFSNRMDAPPRALSPGIYGLSNETLDCPWPKVVKGKQRLSDIVGEEGPIDAQRLLDILSDRQPAPDEELPHRGRDIELERRVSPIFMVSDQYGTRASTVMLVGRAQAELVEQSFAGMGKESGLVRKMIQLSRK